MAKTKEIDKEINEAEALLLETDDYDETPPNDIVAFNELRSCADLLRMYNADQLDIKPDFQRDVVWPKTAQTRFIDSLVKQLPIPSMCISLDYNTGDRLMIDGLQRIWSVICFLSDPEFKLSNLGDIDARISGKTVKTICDRNKDIYSRVENVTIPITVLRCDYTKKSHMEYLFTIFHRLNTGGNKLSNQEIRNCIYQGSLNNALKSMAHYKNFRLAFRLEDGKSYRFQFEEFILRVLAMNDRFEKYNGKLAHFLNYYMSENQKLDDESIDRIKNQFERTVNTIFHKILSKKPFPAISRTTIEALFIAVMRNLNTIEDKPASSLKKIFHDIRHHEQFSLDRLKEGLSHTSKVRARLEAAIAIAADA